MGPRRESRDAVERRRALSRDPTLVALRYSVASRALMCEHVSCPTCSAGPGRGARDAARHARAEGCDRVVDLLRSGARGRDGRCAPLPAPPRDAEEFRIPIDSTRETHKTPHLLPCRTSEDIAPTCPQDPEPKLHLPEHSPRSDASPVTRSPPRYPPAIIDSLS